MNVNMVILPKETTSKIILGGLVWFVCVCVCEVFHLRLGRDVFDLNLCGQPVLRILGHQGQD